MISSCGSLVNQTERSVQPHRRPWHLSSTWGLLQVCENINQLLAFQGKAPRMQVGPSMRWPSPLGTHPTSSPARAFPDQRSAQREVMSAQLSHRVSWHNHDFKKSNFSLQAWRVSSLVLPSPQCRDALWAKDTVLVPVFRILLHSL